MDIICHRGLWNTQSRQNSKDALISALENGFGIETDIRNEGMEIIISHDIVNIGESLFLEEILEIYNAKGFDQKLVLNIKCDGLGEFLQKLLIKYNISNYFLFDMSIPETLKYLKLSLNVLYRLSEFEDVSELYLKSSGIWLDSFKGFWIPNIILEKYLSNSKVFIVSDELHGRDYLKTWEFIKKFELKNINLCTDLPFEARDFYKIYD